MDRRDMQTLGICSFTPPESSEHASKISPTVACGPDASGVVQNVLKDILTQTDRDKDKDRQKRQTTHRECIASIGRHAPDSCAKFCIRFPNRQPRGKTQQTNQNK